LVNAFGSILKNQRQLNHKQVLDKNHYMRFEKSGSNHVERIFQAKIRSIQSLPKSKFQHIKFHRIRLKVLIKLEASSKLLA